MNVCIYDLGVYKVMRERVVLWVEGLKVGYGRGPFAVNTSCVLQGPEP